MCLRVTHIPGSNTAAMAVECVKKLNRHANGTLSTYFKYASIPSNGVLLPRRHSLLSPDNPPNRNQAIEGGAIHAYTKGLMPIEPALYYVPTFLAFAFGVIAYGDSYDLVCNALYIPNMDITGDKKQRLAQCRAWQQSKRITKAQVIKVFPEMKKALKHFR